MTSSTKAHLRQTPPGGTDISNWWMKKSTQKKTRSQTWNLAQVRENNFKKNVITACRFGFMKGGHYRMSPIFITPPKTSPFKVSEVFCNLKLLDFCPGLEVKQIASSSFSGDFTWR